MAIRLNNLVLLFLVGERFEFGGYVCGMVHCAGGKVCSRMTIRSAVRLPQASGKRLEDVARDVLRPSAGNFLFVTAALDAIQADQHDLEGQPPGRLK